MSPVHWKLVETSWKSDEGFSWVCCISLCRTEGTCRNTGDNLSLSMAICVTFNMNSALVSCSTRSSSFCTWQNRSPVELIPLSAMALLKSTNSKSFMLLSSVVSTTTYFWPHRQMPNTLKRKTRPQLPKPQHQQRIKGNLERMLRLAVKPLGGTGARPWLMAMRHRSSFHQPSSSRVKRTLTKEEAKMALLQEEMRSDKWYVRWWAVFRTREFQKKMTWYYVGSYAVFLFLGWKYMGGLYKKDQELDEITGKMNTLGQVNEYEMLRWKLLTGKARHRDEKKLEEYQKLKAQGVTDFDDVVVEVKGQNVTNEKILPPRDTTDFYDSKAEDYDGDIDWEEKMVFMGKRRKWLMKHCRGDVLEVSCGTGRNIKFMAMEQIKSITFLDSSKKMMEIANKKFREKFPTYKNAAFVVGRAEDLVDLAQGNQPQIEVSDVDDKQVSVTEHSSAIKYDTIIEAFGLCSHEDPVKALKNFATLLKPGGRIVLLEHGRGEYDLINEVLDNRAEKRLESWGCRWNLDIGEILDDSGLEVTEEKRTHLGTTWCIVAKKKEDKKRKEEMSFVEKYISPGIQRRLEQMRVEEEKLKAEKVFKPESQEKK